MVTPISKIPKPEASKYAGKRKLLLIPLFLLTRETPEDGMKLFEAFWDDVRDHIHNLERSLGTASHVYHEAIFEEGEAGLSMVGVINPLGNSLISELCQSTARVESTDNKALLQEGTDWQRCLSIGLVSVDVMNTAMEGYRKSTEERYSHIANRINDTLKDGETGVLFIREDHKVQFPTDIQVFYVSPPSLDPLKRWLDEQFREAQERFQKAQESAANQPSDDSDSPESLDGNSVSKPSPAEEDPSPDASQ